MAGENAPVKQDIIKTVTSLGLPNTTVELSLTQLGWLKLEKGKRKTFDDLSKNELALQGMVAKIKGNKVLEEVQASLKEAKNLLAETKEQRLTFTNVVQAKLIDEAMAFEKRMETLLKEGEAHELNLRKEANKSANAENEKNNEKGRLKTHIENEYYRLAANYRASLNTAINDSYVMAIKGKYDAEQLAKHIETTKNAMAAIKLLPLSKFDLKLLNKEEATAVYKSVKAYDPTDDFNGKLKELDEKFAMYDQDVQAADAAIAASEKEAKEKADREKEQLELNKATATFVGAAETAKVDAPKIKVKLELVDENTQEWAVKIIAHFIKNAKDAVPKLRVRSWSKLSIKQMGEALTKLAEQGVQFDGLQFKTIEK